MPRPDPPPLTAPARRPAAIAPDRHRSLRHLAQCTRGLEPVLADELATLGATGVSIVPGGVLFAADHALACRATFWLRSAVRVLEPVTSGRVGDFDQLYELVSRQRWEDLIGPRHTFAVRASVTNGPFTDRHFAALKVKDAVVDRIRSRHGQRPDVERHDPDVPLRLVVRGEEAHLFRDLAGDSLHRRGYRPVQVKSPLSEAVAAGLLLLTAWDGKSPVLDPLCGSGTFIIEAAALAADRAPGFGRSFAAERFPDGDPALWRRLREEARDRLRPKLGFAMLGVDRHDGAIGIAKTSAQAAGLGELVEFRVADAASFEPPFEPALVVTNPPWGERVGEGDDLIASWRALGTLLRRCPGALAYVLSGAPELTRHIGLRSSQRWPVRIGQFDARWLRYEMLPRRGAAAP
jgi:23S rRNA (guanine2445-N2)-methyltransferase